MRTIHAHLRSIAAQARAMLVGRRLAQAAAIAVPIALALVLLDYWLRLPGAARGLLLLVALALGGVWLVTRLRKALAFAPGLPELALRAEAAFPELRGVFATAVELGGLPEGAAAPSPVGRELAAATVARGSELAGSRSFKSALLSWRTTGRTLGLAAFAALVLGSSAAMAPRAAAIAAQRWLMPWSDAAWPTRQQVEDTTPPATWLPVDERLMVRAKVARGFHVGQAMQVRWSVDGVPQETVEAKVQERPDGAGGEVLLELPHETVAALASGRSASAEVQWQVRVGDALTAPATRRVAARPEVTEVRARTTPPAYAAGLAPEQDIDLARQEGAVATATALTGSEVDLQVRFNKPLAAELDLAAFAPGLAAAKPSLTWEKREGRITGLQARFTLDATVQTKLLPKDDTGLAPAGAERDWRLVAQVDTDPKAMLTDPAADLTALPSAWMPIEAVGEDDLGVAQTRLQAELLPQGEAAKASALKLPDDLLATGRSMRLPLSGKLDLQPLKLAEGDVVVLTAKSRDVFDLHGERHKEGSSHPRRIKLVSEPTLSGEILSNLAQLRATADAAQRLQRRLQGQKADAEAQKKIGAQVEALHQRLAAQRERLTRNRPATLGSLQQLMGDGAALLAAADEASRKAADHLAKSEAAPAAEAQTTVARKLADFSALLDQGRMIGEIRRKLETLIKEQADAAGKAAKLMPQTLGQDPAKLPAELRNELGDLQREQGEVAAEADGLLGQMRALERSLGQQNERTPEAMAARQVLDNAARVGESRDLRGDTRNAAQDVAGNRLAQAGARQKGAGDTMEEMRRKLDEFEKLRDEARAKLLAEAAAEAGKLAKEQAALNAEMKNTPADGLPALQGRQNDLKSRTEALTDKAESAGAKPETAQKLGDAARAEGSASQAQGQGDKSEAEAEGGEAQKKLEEAQKELDQQSGADQARQREEKKAKLRSEYLKLAERMKALQADLAPTRKAEPSTRAAWQALNDARTNGTPPKPAVNDEQAAVRAGAKELGDIVGEEGSVVFERVHGQLDAACERAQGGLDEFRNDDQVAYDQRRAERLLRAMADAFKPGDGKQQDSGGGGGGGGGGQKPKLVPPLAELLLLRANQEDLIERTTDAEKQAAGRSKDTLTRDLGAEQRELKNTLEDWLKAQQGGGNGGVQ